MLYIMKYTLNFIMTNIVADITDVYILEIKALTVIIMSIMKTILLYYTKIT